jgi:PAS domain S-box-containing protein
MNFVAEKDPGLIPQVLSKILDSCVNGVTLADPDLDDMPIVYVNRAFETMTGYEPGEIIGHNCRFLQGEDRDQEARHRIRQAIEQCEAVDVTIRNYRKDGTLFHNHLMISPLFDGNGEVIYFLGVQYDVSSRVRADDEIRRLREQLEILSGAKTETART